MDKQKIKKLVENGDWVKWLQRPFFGFIPSLFAVGNTKEYFKKIGVANTELESWVFDHGYWYSSVAVFEKMVPSLDKWLSKHSLAEITKRLDKFYKKEKIILAQHSRQPEKNLTSKLKHFEEIMRLCSTYIWLAHSVEHLFNKKITTSVSRYIPSEKIDEFVRLATAPTKLTATEKMDRALVAGQSMKKILRDYSWVRCRDGFCDPYRGINKLCQNHKTVCSASKSSYSSTTKKIVRRSP